MHGRNIFQKRDMHFIHLSVNSLPSKIDKMRYIAKLTNAIVIGVTETKPGNTFSNRELETECYDLIRHEQSQRGGSSAGSVKNSISYNLKPYFLNIFCIFL